MRILTRYVLFDLLKVFSLTLTGLTLLIFIVLIGKEAVDKGIGLGPLMQMAPYLIPQSMQFAVPGTMLLATTSVYGRMSSYNEIVAIKSLGISPMALVWPTLILATFVSFIAVTINDLAVSWGVTGVRRVFLASIEEVTYGQLSMRHTTNMGKVNMSVRDVDGHRLIEPTLVVQSSGGRPAWTIAAREAEMSLRPAEGKLVVDFYDFELQGAVNYSDPGKFPFEMSVEDLTGSSEKNRSPSNYALSEIAPAIQEQEQQVSRVHQANIAQTAFGLLTGDFNALSNTAWKANQQEIETAQVRLHRLYTEPWRRWANGFSCLCFVLIGVPVAVRMRYSEFIASFFVCFLPILLVYYPLLAVSVDHAKDGSFPPQSVWLGNLVLAIAGIWLLWRVNRN
ncbi:MAG TPA: LptF/LptG family permease [Lacipirellulaceae bacterium]|jgi:lipopolysaccharide export system permease protein|nr:LptF/LptG family permease [Lacipirellulaceae bacterium]